MEVMEGDRVALVMESPPGSVKRKPSRPFAFLGAS